MANSPLKSRPSSRLNAVAGLLSTIRSHGREAACGALAALALMLSLASGMAHAQALKSGTPQTPAYDEVQRLTRAGQWTEAVARADAHLAALPRDPQMRFLKAAALAQGGQTGEAQAALQALTQEYPELPEPHNNLAVLLAAQGQYEAARSALEAAIRLNPRYAIAHQNLADVQIKLAAQALARAAEIEPGDAALRQRLQALIALIRPASPPPAAAATPPASGAAAAPSPTPTR